MKKVYALYGDCHHENAVTEACLRAVFGDKMVFTSDPDEIPWDDLSGQVSLYVSMKENNTTLKADGTLDPKVLGVDTNTLVYQVPGGMLSNLISQLKQANKEEKYYDVLEEIPIVRKDFGYPPLVTPTSQIVGTQAVFNVLMGRYKTFTKESKAVLAGEYGALPGEVNEEVRRMAIGDKAPITCRPADLLTPELDKYEQEVKDMGYYEQEEDVLSYALFPQVATKFFEARKAAKEPPKAAPAPAPQAVPAVTNLYVEDPAIR